MYLRCEVREDLLNPRPELRLPYRYTQEPPRTATVIELVPIDIAGII